MSRLDIYKAGLQHYLRVLGQDHPRYAEALTLQSRLTENIDDARLHGDSETARAERARIIDALNRLAMETTGTSFNALCDAVARQEPARHNPDPVRDGPQGEPPRPGMTRPQRSDLPPCPFVAGPKIMDPRLFVGRKEALHRLVTAMEGVQPTSVNVVGERRIGKSSLLYHLFQTWEQRVQATERYVVTYLSLQDAAAQREVDFYRAICQALLARPKVQRHNSLVAALNQRPLDRSRFAAVVRQFHDHALLPVFCLDEFEALLRRPDRFGDDFYDALRSLMDDNVLMLILASLKPLDIYRRQHRFTSKFFNLGHVLILRDLREEEAADLVRLPASTVPGASAALGLEEQRLARQWGGRHPCLLQLAAAFLCQARQEGKDVAWARKRFAAEARRIPRSGFRLRRLGRPLRWVVWDVPARLGRLARGLGGAVDEMTNWIIGVVILTVVILTLLGVLTGPQIVDLLHRLLGG